MTRCVRVRVKLPSARVVRHLGVYPVTATRDFANKSISTQSPTSLFHEQTSEGGGGGGQGHSY